MDVARSATPEPHNSLLAGILRGDRRDRQQIVSQLLANKIRNFLNLPGVPF